MNQWNERVVVVTGGSDGLGLAIVGAFAARGATVVSVARDPGKNAASIDVLLKSGRNVFALSADVTCDDSINSAVASIENTHGGIDVWVNNVGKSTRADIMKTDVDDYREFMELNFYAAVRCWNAASASLIRSDGHLVNIGSLASKTAWPLMAPYSTSKHALSAFSHQLRLEGPANVHFLHVCPGPIRRASAENRYVATSSDLAESAARPGAGAPVKGVAPEVVANKIIRACERRKGEIVIPAKARLLFAISQLSSTLGDSLLRKFVKKK